MRNIVRKRVDSLEGVDVIMTLPPYYYGTVVKVVEISEKGVLFKVVDTTYTQPIGLSRSMDEDLLTNLEVGDTIFCSDASFIYKRDTHEQKRHRSENTENCGATGTD